MSQNEVKKSDISDEEIRQLVAESDTGGRRPQGLSAKIVMHVALAWSMFQLWIASPLPFSLGVFVLNDTQSRAIHLAFAMFLGYMLFPPLKSSPRTRIPVQDWILALLGAFCAAYLYLFYAELAARPGQPTTLDLTVAVVGIVLLLEATRRVVGLPMAIMATIFLGYIFLGPYMPDMIAHKGASFAKGMTHQWLSTEGVFASRSVSRPVSSSSLCCSARSLIRAAPATTSSSRRCRFSVICAAARPRPRSFLPA